MKQSKLRRVGFALVALVVALALTITSTYAWFTISGAPEVQGMDLTVLTGTELLMISFDQSEDWATQAHSGNFKTKLDAADFNTLVDTIVSGLDHTAFRLGAFTSTDGEAVTDELGVTVAANVTDTLGGWLEFEIRFRGDSAAKVALLKTSQVVIPALAAVPLSGLKPIYAWPEMVTNKTDYGIGPATSLVVGGKMFFSAAYAARYSFTDSLAAVGTTYVWNPQTTGDITDPRTAEPDYYVVTDSGAKNLSVAYRNYLMNGTVAPVAPAANTLELLLEGEANKATATIMLQLVAHDNTALTGHEGVAGQFYGSLTVRVWVEGWDSACLNAILRDTFSTNLIFTIFEPV